MTLNGRSLLYVAILGLVIIYMFGLIAFIFIRDVYQGNLHFCESLYKCTLSTIREGLLYKLTVGSYDGPFPLHQLTGWRWLDSGSTTPSSGPGA